MTAEAAEAIALFRYRVIAKAIGPRLTPAERGAIVRTLAHCGSGDGLKVSVRWGCSPKARQMRLIVGRLRPVAAAIERVLQCVASCGVDSSLLTMTAST